MSKILIACERTGRVRDAFIKRGHDAISCDLEDTMSPGPHIKGDVTELLSNTQWDIVIAFPPCTRLCNSGVRWLHERDLWEDMRAGAAFFLKCLNANAPLVAVENPIMHGHAKKIIGVQQTQIVQPWMFGHAETKATCLWLKGLPTLVETNNVKYALAGMEKKDKHKVHWRSGPDPWMVRNATCPGMATAMADKWG